MTAHVAGGDSPAREIAFERVEFGKFQDEMASGSAEHTVLARSRGFPEELLGYCGPRQIGPSLTDIDPLPEWAPHGSVLQPVCAAGAIWPVFSQVVPITERRLNRNYQRARFLVAAQSVSPLSYWQAMGHDPLREYVRPAAQDVVIVPSISSCRAAPHPAEDHFLNPALAHILAGHPVCIAGPIEEQAFFALADTLWQTLPAHLRSLFSAGWGVGASQKRKLIFSAGFAVDQYSAVFDHQTGAWLNNPPLPGERPNDYLKFVFQCDAAANPADGQILDWIAAIVKPEALAPGTLRWDQDAVKGTFIALERATADAWRLRRWDEALLRQDWSLIDPEKLTENLWLQESSETMVRRLITAIDQPGACNAAARALAWLFQEKTALTTRVLGKCQPAESKAACEFFEDCKTDPEALLTGCVSDPANLPPSDPVKTEARIASLNSSLKNLTPTLARLHDAVLAFHNPPLFYREFVDRSWWRLAVALDGVRIEASEKRLHDIGRLLPTTPPEFEWLLQLTSCRDVPHDLGHRVAENRPEYVADLINLIRNRYRLLPKLGYSQQNCWLEWGLEFIPEGDMPLLDVVRSARENRPSKPITPWEAEKLMEDVAEGRIPGAAEQDLAHTALKALRHFLPGILQLSSQWSAIARYWPENVARLLTPKAQGKRGLSAVFTYLPAGSIEYLITHWTDTWRDYVCKNGVAADLLELAKTVKDQDIAAPTVRFCLSVLRTGRDALRMTSLDVACAQRAAYLFRCLDKREKEQILGNSPEAAWHAAGSGAALLFLLIVFPDFDFRVTLAQHEWLGEVREPLRQHLNECPRRQPEFWLAEASFHQYSYEDHSRSFPGRHTWLWAAFRGVPMTEQGRLDRALHYYASTREERVSLCKQYLEKSVDPRAAAQIAYQQFLKPAVFEALGAAYSSRFYVLLEDPAPQPALAQVVEALPEHRLIQLVPTVSGFNLCVNRDFWELAIRITAILKMPRNRILVWEF